MDKVATPGRTLALLREKGVVPRKSRGQHFLIDTNIVRKIVEAAQLCPEDVVVEVGPGLGALTQGLAERAGLVIAVEIDPCLVQALKEIFQGKHQVHIVEGDALKMDLDAMVARYAGAPSPYKLVANLPYYITTPLMFHFLEKGVGIKLMVLMVQAEVGHRMIAHPGSKDYGALSLAVQYYTEPFIVARVPASVFYPRPKVDSVIVKLICRENPPVKVEDKDLFFAVIRTSFNHRRKTLANALAFTGVPKEVALKALAEAGINPQRRGETLSIEEFALLSNTLKSSMGR
ncbi:MAG TPA: 16S rRNA (adenine(1518)-N(6)/adenine(1519)-N(6))-dimethyltransferase RsmA [Moorella mulderi]|nr:16S rRNA (adenine(1518)-N(6)/adenine(1519)-N(6))-dimethyltransferase RsmA [Moorella mulderi]